MHDVLQDIKQLLTDSKALLQEIQQAQVPHDIVFLPAGTQVPYRPQ